LEWSLNGEKLFSGDSEGVVGFTQMDFYMVKKRCPLSKRFKKEYFDFIFWVNFFTI
jgi:hypothetical protein